MRVKQELTSEERDEPNEVSARGYAMKPCLVIAWQQAGFKVYAYAGAELAERVMCRAPANECSGQRASSKASCQNESSESRGRHRLLVYWFSNCPEAVG